VIDGDRVVVSSHEAGLIGLRISHQPDGTWTANEEWRSKNLAINFASPVLVGDHLYGVGPQKNLICVDVKSGQPAWSKDGFFTGNPGKSYAGMIVMGTNVLTLTDDGQLVLFVADPSGYKEISRERICGKTWCIPAYADGKVYLRDEKELICLQLLP
jgi:outer membrane protein assembly factor BamB